MLGSELRLHFSYEYYVILDVSAEPLPTYVVRNNSQTRLSQNVLSQCSSGQAAVLIRVSKESADLTVLMLVALPY